MDNSTAVQTIWQFVEFFWWAQSPSAKTITEWHDNEWERYKGLLYKPYLHTLHLSLKLSHKARSGKRQKSFLSGYTSPAARQKEETQRCSVELKPALKNTWQKTLFYDFFSFFVSLLFLLINLLIRDTEQDEEETEMLSHQKMQDF